MAETPYVLRWETINRLIEDNDWSSGTVDEYTVRLFRSGVDDDEIDQESFVDETLGDASSPPLPFEEAEDRLLARHGISRDDVTIEDEDCVKGFD